MLRFEHDLTQQPPFLRYPFYVFSAPKSATIILYFGTTLDCCPGEKMSYSLQIDDQASETQDLLTTTPAGVAAAREHGWPTAEGWFEAASDNVWVKRHEVAVDTMRPGAHELKIALNHSNLLIEKIVVDLGKVAPSCLGPPPSFFVRSSSGSD